MKPFLKFWKGLLLAVGIFLLAGFVFGAFGYLHESGAHDKAYIPVIMGMAILAILGFVLRRWLWPQRKQAWKITAAGFLLFLLIHLAIGVFAGENAGLVSWLQVVGHIMFIYGPWFWLPFVIGVLAGGFRRKTIDPEKPGNAPCVRPAHHA